MGQLKLHSGISGSKEEVLALETSNFT